jgi:hypothetical protein
VRRSFVIFLITAFVSLLVVAYSQKPPEDIKPPQAVVPSLEGQELAAAREEVGDDFELVSSYENSDQPEGTVIIQSPEPGTKAERGASISVVVSDGPEIVQLPDVVGKVRDEAEGDLSDAGFKVEVKTEESLEEGVGKVLEQSPTAGAVKKGSEVKITVGQAPKPPPGYTLVEDATGRLTVEVPSEWETMTSENVTVKVLNMEGYQIDQEEASAVINAAPDLDNWQHSSAGAGTSLLVVQELAQKYSNDQLIDSVPALHGFFADVCEAGARENLDRDSYSSRVQTWNDCNLGVPTYFTFAAAPQSRECAVIGQIGIVSEGDQEAAQRILDTFEVDCGAIGRIGPGSRAIVNVALADERLLAG